MSTAVPDPRDARLFHFNGCRYNPVTGEAQLAYRVDEGPDLIERITFPGPPQVDGAAAEAFGSALQLLHWIAGVSYWKAGLAPEMRFAGAAPPGPVRQFLAGLYVQGLAEFAHVNRLNVAARLHLPRASGGRPQPQRLSMPERALVAMGGGKDSLVGLELARQAGLEVQPWCVGESPLIGETVAAAGLDLLRIGRRLAPELRAMNAAGAWNGHVPVTAINSSIGVCAALLYSYRYVVFSNERSADEATLTGSDGVPVNHQFSKTSAYESSFRAIVRDWISPDVGYFSILRPFSELDVVRRFSALERFHGVFSSCNRNFHLAGSTISGRWCGDCPKCRFATLSLAVFLPPPAVRAIIGADLLDDPRQESGFRALCALGADKPFECVGETGESRAALQALTQQPAWRDRLLVRRLAAELPAVAVPPLETLFRASSHHFIPGDIAARLEGL